MSDQNGVISFDLQHGKGGILDVASMYPLSEVHAIRSTKPILDTLKSGKGRVYDFSLSRKMSLKRFRTLVTLDLSTPELWQPSLVTAKILSIRPRFHTIDLVPALEIPFGALDLRKGRPILSPRTYPDLYRRSLPASLHLRREWTHTKDYMKRKRKSLVITSVWVLILSVPTLFYAKFLVEDGYRRLTDMRQFHDRVSTVENIRAASRDFERANILFMPFRIIPSDTIRLAALAIDGGIALTRGISTITDRLPEVMSGTVVNTWSVSTTENTDAISYRAPSRDIALLASLGIDSPTDWLKENHRAIAELGQSLDEAGKAFARIRSIDSDRKDEVLHIANALEKLGSILHFYETHEQDILTMLGHNEPERYIIFNQNRDEIRANGGFPGSVITFTLYKGNVLDYRMDDVYYYDWNLYPYKELPPPGLSLITGNYGLRDVNYYPDFHDTIEKANAFIEQSGDATITTGIAIHQGLIEDLLKATWPITLSGVTEPITSDNFSPLMSTLVEARHGANNTPKDILFRFITALGTTIKEKKLYDTVLDTLTDAVIDGEILFASRDSGVDAFLAQFRTKLPWECSSTNSEQWVVSSEFPRTKNPEPRSQNTSCSQNWAYPLLTSVSGNKSDRFIHRLYESQTTPIGKCTYENRITFTHTHIYAKTDTKDLEKYMDMIGMTDPKAREKMLFIEGNGKNRTYMRLYTPRGSTLTGSTLGIEKVEKPEATVFTWLLETPVASSASKTIRYITKTDNCSESDATLTWYRQPWMQSTTFRAK